MFKKVPLLEINKKFLILTGEILIICGLFFFLRRIYSNRVGAFGCFDDCFNITAGYFLLKGRHLYSEIFFNHQPLMAYISWIIQLFGKPITLFTLISQHRQFIFAAGLIFDIFLVIRFGLAGLLFTFLYESTKYYVFGNRFLAEALVLYFAVYLLGIFWKSMRSEKIYAWDLFLTGIFCWAIFFLREPYVPLALKLTTAIFLYNIKRKKLVLMSIAIFAFLSFLIFLQWPIRDYVFNVFTVNKQVEIGAKNFSFTTLLYAFAYPFVLPFYGVQSILRTMLIGLSTLLFISAITTLISQKKIVLPMLATLLFMFLANLRPVTPGTLYYEAFHMTVWYGLFIFFIALLLQETPFKIKMILSFCFMFLVFYALFAPSSFVREKINGQYEFTTNYANDYSYGKVVKSFASPSDTIFLDGADDLIYWQSGIISPYRYSWFTSIMPGFPIYQKSRIEMFSKHAPTFYYGDCNREFFRDKKLPETIKNEYQQMYFSSIPTCLYVRKEKIAQLKETQLKEAEKLEFYFPTPIESGPTPHLF